jgi:hypothetical protein
VKKTNRYDAIKKLTPEQRKEILDFARERSREILAGGDMPKLEKDIEKRFCEYAKAQGCYPIKFEDPARRGAPDRMVLCPGGKVFFVEFKRKGETLRHEQAVYIKRLLDLGHDADIVDCFEDAKCILDFTLKP